MSNENQNRTPRIGRPSIIDLSPAEVDARTAAGIALDAPLSGSEVNNRKAERAVLVQQTLAAAEPPTAPTIAVSKGQTVTAILADLAAHGRAPDLRVRDEQKAKAEALARPLLRETQSLLTKHGILRARHLARIEEVSNSDWLAIRRATPEGLVFNGRQYVAINHQALNRLRQAAAFAVSVLVSSFGDTTPGKHDMDPVSLQGAVRGVESLLNSPSAFDSLTAEISEGYRHAIDQLKMWLGRARGVVGSAERGVEAFLAADAHLRTTLAGVVMDTVEPTPPSLILPKLPAPPPEPGTSSFTDFDPREHGTERFKSGGR